MKKKRTITQNFGILYMSSLMLFALTLMCILPHFQVIAADATPALGLSANLFCQSDTSDATNSNKVSDLGSNLTCYLGKSFYEEDDYFKGQIANIAFYDCALSSAQVANISTTVIAPDTEPEEDKNPVTGEKIILFEGEAWANNWAQPVSVYTAKNNGSFNSNNIKAGVHFYVEYSGTRDVLDFVLQSWSNGPSRAKVTMTDSGEVNGHYYAVYSYNNCVSAFGSSDFSSLLDGVHVSAAGEDITVYSLYYEYNN